MREQAVNAIGYLQRNLPGDLTLSEIGQLKVDEVLRLLNKEGLERDEQENKDNQKIEEQKIQQNKIKVQLQQAEAKLKLYQVKL